MDFTRRDLSLMLPALAAAQAEAQAQEKIGRQPSGSFRYEDLTAKPNGPGSSRQAFKGETHSGYVVDMHITELPGGQAPHPPHHHVHEEMVLVFEGQLDVTIKGKTTRLGPGSSAYVASNEEHGWRNPGTGATKYFVLALGQDA